MRLSVLHWLALGVGGIGFATLVALLALLGHVELALAIPVALFAGLLIAVEPFWGLLGIVLLTQLDGIASAVLSGLPISGVKLLTFVTAGAVLLNSAKVPRAERFRSDELGERLAILFAIALVISFLFADHLGLAFSSLRRLLSVLLLFYLTLYLVRSERQFRFVLWAIVGSSFISGSISIVDWVFGIRLFAGFESQWAGIARSAGASDYNPTTASHMLFVGTAIAGMLALHSRRFRLFNLITVAVGGAGLVLSFARSGALLAGLGVGWVVLKYRHHRRLPAFLLSGALVAGAALPLVPDTYWARLGTLAQGLSDNTLERRVGYHLIGADLLFEDPIVGIGPGNYFDRYRDVAYRFMPGRTPGGRPLHNTYFEVAVENGLLGFACFAALLLCSLRGLRRARRQEASSELRVLADALHFGFVLFLVACLMMPHEYNKYLWVMMGLGFVAGRLASQAEAATSEGACDPSGSDRRSVSPPALGPLPAVARSL